MQIVKDWGVSNIEFAFNAMRAPFESFDKADQVKDLDLLTRLTKRGSEHRKILRMINWNVEIKAPRYWYLQLDTYKIGSLCSSSSTMHLLMKKHLTLDDFDIAPTTIKYSKFQNTIDTINSIIDNYNKETNIVKKRYWADSAFSILPQSYIQLRFMQFNYETLLTIFKQRNRHILGHWHDFCDYIFYNLPYFITLIKALSS